MYELWLPASRDTSRFSSWVGEIFGSGNILIRVLMGSQGHAFMLEVLTSDARCLVSTCARVGLAQGTQL